MKFYVMFNKSGDQDSFKTENKAILKTEEEIQAKTWKDPKIIQFYSGNCEELFGEIHLFQSPNDYNIPSEAKNSKPTNSKNSSEEFENLDFSDLEEENEDDEANDEEIQRSKNLSILQKSPGSSEQITKSNMILVLYAPYFMSLLSLLDFFASFWQKMKKVKFLFDKLETRYMMLIEFDTIDSASQFFLEFNGKSFNTFTKYERCGLVFVNYVKMLDSPNHPNAQHPHVEQSVTDLTKQNEIDETFGKNSDPACMLKELPTCPVCLERLDTSQSCIVTTLCNHEFHMDCLKQWGDFQNQIGTCPVCRYTYTHCFLTSHQKTPTSESADVASEIKCSVCGETSDLWVCLTCGFVGCGRYKKKHAYAHYMQTECRHCYSMSIGSNQQPSSKDEELHGRVWDYNADCYVHRLILNQADGKIIEIPENPRIIKKQQKNNEETNELIEDFQDEQEIMEATFESKIDSIINQYNELLTSQLTQQKDYFESILWKNQKTQEEEISNFMKQIVELKEEKSKMEKKINKLTKQVEKKNAEAEEDKNLNKQLLKTQEKFNLQLKKIEETWAKKCNEKDNKIEDLEGQVRDLMIHFEAQEKLANLQENEKIQSTTIVVNESKDDKKKKKK